MATNYREILRLAKLGYSQRSIAARSTVQRVLERAGSNPHTLEELLALSDKGIQQALFPASSIPSTRKPPDYERVHRELAKNGVTLSLLWNEYCEECYASKELPLMYTSFACITGNTPSKRKPPEISPVEWGTFSLLGREGGAPHQGSDPRDAFKPEGGTAILPGVHGASEVGGQIFLNQAGVRLWTGSPVYRHTQLQNHPNDPQNGQRPSQRGTGNKRRVLRFHQGRGLLRRG